MVYIYDIPREVATYLLGSYGTRAMKLVQDGHESGRNKRLIDDLPHLESEVLYSVHQEMAQKPNDVICRRFVTGIVDQKAGESLSQKVVEIMGDELKWNKKKRAAELEECLQMIPMIK
jgi:glycerol-3-phosphate dehydrogenase